MPQRGVYSRDSTSEDEQECVCFASVTNVLRKLIPSLGKNKAMVGAGVVPIVALSPYLTEDDSWLKVFSNLPAGDLLAVEDMTSELPSAAWSTLDESISYGKSDAESSRERCVRHHNASMLAVDIEEKMAEQRDPFQYCQSIHLDDVTLNTSMFEEGAFDEAGKRLLQHELFVRFSKFADPFEEDNAYTLLWQGFIRNPERLGADAVFLPTFKRGDAELSPLNEHIDALKAVGRRERYEDEGPLNWDLSVCIVAISRTDGRASLVGAALPNSRHNRMHFSSSNLVGRTKANGESIHVRADFSVVDDAGIVLFPHDTDSADTDTTRKVEMDPGWPEYVHGIMEQDRLEHQH